MTWRNETHCPAWAWPIGLLIGQQAKLYIYFRPVVQSTSLVLDEPRMSGLGGLRMGKPDGIDQRIKSIIFLTLTVPSSLKVNAVRYPFSGLTSVKFWT